jgi:hypothetical protein
MRPIAFYVGLANLRGTSIASYDYAEGSETVLGRRALILIDEAAPHDPLAIERFQRRFPVIACDGPDAIDRALERERAEIVHVLKGDGRDKWVARAAPTAVHQVFPVWPRDIHGERYAFVSRWLARYSAGPKAAWVPHVVALPAASGDLRAELQIPADAMVAGCHGSPECIELDFVRRALARALDARRDFYFVGLNLAPFLQHSRAIFLPGTADTTRKRRFIDTCDVMVHARHKGETFGLSVAEFSICNRPVFAWSGNARRAHFDMLGDAALRYRGERDLLRMLLHLDRGELSRRDWDRYSRDYAPEPVMARFDDVFIRNPADPARLRSTLVGPDEFSLGGLARYARRWRRRLRGKGP